MLKIGLEKEVFLTDDKDNIVEPNQYGLTIDECGYLAELRSIPSSDPYKVAYSLIMEIAKLEDQIKKIDGLYISRANYINVKPKIASNFLRAYGKHSSHVFNLYGNRKPYSLTFLRAGIHVHFSDCE